MSPRRLRRYGKPATNRARSSIRQLPASGGGEWPCQLPPHTASSEVIYWCEAAVDRGLRPASRRCRSLQRQKTRNHERSLAHCNNTTNTTRIHHAASTEAQQSLQVQQEKKTIPATFLLPMFAILSSPLRMRRLKSNRIANFLFSVDRADSAQEA